MSKEAVNQVAVESFRLGMRIAEKRANDDDDGYQRGVRDGAESERLEAARERQAAEALLGGLDDDLMAVADAVREETPAETMGFWRGYAAALRELGGLNREELASACKSAAEAVGIEPDGTGPDGTRPGEPLPQELAVRCEPTGRRKRISGRRTR